MGTNLLHKPFTEEIFISKVREVLDGGKNKNTLPDLKPELEQVESRARDR